MREDWIEVEVNELGEVITGGTPSKKISEYYSKNDYPFYKPTDLNKGYIVKKSTDFLSELGFQNSRSAIAGSVLVTCIGATIGKTGLIKKKGAFNQQINAITPHEYILSEYLYFQIVAPEFQEQIKKNASSTTLPILNKGKFSKLPFLIPPLPEQRAIVAKIEELFSDLDKGIADLKKAQDQLKIYRQAVLKKAFEGELALLELSEVVKNIQAGKSFRCEERPPTLNEVGVLKVSAVSWGKFQEIESKTVTDPSRVNPNYFVAKGDFLLSRANTIELVGNSVIVKKISKTLMLSDKTLRITFHEGYNPEYILYFLRTRAGRNQIENLSTGNQASMRNIGQKRIKQIKVPFPACLEEQLQIVKEIESRLSVCDKVEQDIAESLEKAKALRQSILKKAFEGNLLSEVEIAACKAAPDYEPASVLLERIKLEKAFAKASASKGKKKK